MQQGGASGGSKTHTAALSLPCAPPPLPAATLLGATIGDRLRVNAKWAQRGLYVSTDGERQPLQFVGRLQSRLVRWRLALHVGLLRLAFWLSSALHTLTAYAVPLAE